MIFWYFCKLFVPRSEGPPLNWSKLKKKKKNAGDILECIQNEKRGSYKVENIVRKGEIACYK